MRGALRLKAHSRLKPAAAQGSLTKRRRPAGRRLRASKLRISVDPCTSMVTTTRSAVVAVVTTLAPFGSMTTISDAVGTLPSLLKMR